MRDNYFAFFLLAARQGSAPLRAIHFVANAQIETARSIIFYWNDARETSVVHARVRTM